jgi:hypothetical protein
MLALETVSVPIEWRIVSMGQLEEELPKKSSDAAEQADTLRTKSTELRTQITDRVAQLEDSHSKAIEELQERENRLKEEVSSANQSFGEMGKIVKLSVEGIAGHTSEAISRVDSSFEKVQKGAYAVIIAALITYAILLITRGLVLDATTYAAILPIFPLTLLMWYTLSSLQTGITANKYSALEHVRTTILSSKSFSGRKLELDSDLKSPKTGISVALNLVQKIAGNLRGYIPVLDQYYSSRERITRQQEFVITMKNALRGYGILLQGAVEEYLRWFGPPTDSESEWLNKCAPDLSRKVGISPVILTLAYADFTGDQQLLKNAWSEISKSKSRISELSKLLVHGGVLEAEYMNELSDSYGAIDDLISSQDTFTLESFRTSYYDFYVELVREKRSLLDALRTYRVKIDLGSEDSIRKFVPESPESLQRLESLFSIAAEKIGLPVEIISVAYYEREAEIGRRVHSWERLRRKSEALQEFVTLLIDNGIVDVPTHYKTERTGLIAYVLQLLDSSQDFTLQGASQQIRASLGALDLSKNHFLLALSYFRIAISESDRLEFNAWFPTRHDNSGLAAWLSGRTGIPEAIMLLFLHSYLQSVNERKALFAILKDKNLTPTLAKVLLQNGIITKPGSVSVDSERLVASNLSLLLEQEDDFNPIRLQSTFHTSYRLLEYSRSILEFLTGHQLVPKGSETDFASILHFSKGGLDGPILVKLRLFVKEFLRTSAHTFLSTDEWLSAATSACLAIFLDSHGDLLKIYACREAAVSEKSVRIIYQFIKVSEENEQKGGRHETRLLDVIANVIEERFKSYEHIAAFAEELTSGYLYPKISLLVNARLNGIQKQIEHLGQDKRRLEETLQKVSEAVRDFLNSELQQDVILESLNMQLVAAYMITSSSLEAIFTDVVDRYLPRVCEELAKNDSGYSQLLILAKKTSGGKSTRLGIVPFGMDFEEFSKRFDNVFRQAVHQLLANRNHPLEEAESFSANVLRVYPSDVFFKRVEGIIALGGTISEDHPVNVVRNLVIDRYGPVQNLELIASLRRGESKTIVMRSVLKTLFDTRTSIYMIAKSQLQPLLGASKIVDMLESGQFDRELLGEYGYETFTGLAVDMYRNHSRGTDAIRSDLRQRLRENIESITKRGGARPEADQITGIEEATFAALFNVGAVLEGFAS